MTVSETFYSKNGRVVAQFHEGTWTFALYDAQDRQIDPDHPWIDHGTPSKGSIDSALGRSGLSDAKNDKGHTLETFVNKTMQKYQHGTGY